MVKQKGTVLKFKKNLAIIMTNDCKIVSIMRQPGMYVGLEILFSKNELINRKRKLVFSSRIVAGIAAIFIVMFVFFNPLHSDVNAYVTIDANTSIEFELDKNNKILKVNSYNDATNTLLKELDLENQSVDFAIKEVMKKLDLNESTVLISACLKEESNGKSDISAKNKPEEFDKLIDICRSAVEANIGANTQSKVLGVSYDYKKLADENNISIGRSVVFEKAKEQGVDYDIEDIKTKSIGETLKKVKIDDVGVVHNVKKAESKKPDPKPDKKDSPKDKLVADEKKDPKNKVEPIDKPKEKTNSEPKNKAEEKPVVEPKDILEEKPAPKPKDNPKENPKDITESKSDVESKEKTKENPKDTTEGKSDIKPKNNTKEISEGNTEGKSDTEPKENSKEVSKDITEGKTDTELKDSTKGIPEDNTKGKSDTELKESPEKQ